MWKQWFNRDCEHALVASANIHANSFVFKKPIKFKL